MPELQLSWLFLLNISKKQVYCIPYRGQGHAFRKAPNSSQGEHIWLTNKQEKMDFTVQQIDEVGKIGDAGNIDVKENFVSCTTLQCSQSGEIGRCPIIWEFFEKK